MARNLGVSGAYINMLEANQRSLSVQMLMALAEVYGVDWRDLLQDDTKTRLATLREVLRDPVFGAPPPELQELRAALDHAPAVVERLLRLHERHGALLARLAGLDGTLRDEAAPAARAEAARDAAGACIDALEAAAEAVHAALDPAAETRGGALRRHLEAVHGIRVRDAAEGARRRTRTLALDPGLGRAERARLLARRVAELDCAEAVAALVAEAGLEGRAAALFRAELLDYAATALLLPYAPFRAAAEAEAHDLDRLAARFDAEVEAVAERLTTLARPGAEGIAMFLLRIDRAGNVTRRRGAAEAALARHGGGCPRWALQAAFAAPGVVQAQAVALPDGAAFLTLARTVGPPGRPAAEAVVLGCPLEHAERVVYAAREPRLRAEPPVPIGLACRVCPRGSCAARSEPALDPVA